MVKPARRLMGAFMAAVLAAGLVPAPAFAAGGEAVPGLVATALSLVPQALVTPDYGWYKPNPAADEFVVDSSAALVGFANLVNGTAPADVSATAVSFEGATVRMTKNMAMRALEWVPIGDEEHPFEGAFDGGGFKVQNFKISGTGRAAYLGLFGYVGAKGSVNNVTVDSNATIVVSRAKATKEVVHHVAGIAGYCAGSMSNCTNNAKVSVTSAVVQTKANPQVVWAVGGVAGECAGAMEKCANNAVAAVSVSVSSAPVISLGEDALVRYVGGVVGVNGASERIGTSANPIAADASIPAELAGCVNMAKIYVDTPEYAGKDRQGMDIWARGICIGGVAGYAQGNVNDCVNGLVTSTKLNSATRDYGYVRAEHGTAVGGVVGSLRATPSVSSENARTTAGDDGSAGNDPVSTSIELSDCVNYGDVYGLNAVGGVAGSAGSYTTIKQCFSLNRANGTYIVATRWNKPAPAGIVGSTYGNVKFCANQATVASGTWDDEAQRKLKEGSGKLASGLVGMLACFSDDTGRNTPVPEVFACYNAGHIIAAPGWKQGGLVGFNNGSVHDNVALSGVVDADRLIGDEESVYGSATNNTLLSASEMRGKEGVKALNGLCDLLEWENWWVVDYLVDESGNPVLKDYSGYPVLSDSNPVKESKQIDLSGFTAICADAAYTGGIGGGAAIPTATVTDSAGNELVQNVDFRVVPQDGAEKIAADYKATIIGIGAYKGAIENASYSITTARLADCIVTVESVTFDFEGHYPSKDMVTVTTKGGAVIDSDEYVISKVAFWQSGKENTVHTAENPPVNASPNYRVTVRPVSDSRHFSTTSGTTAWGSYRINPADLQTDVDYGNVEITWANKSYKWVSSGDEADTAKPKTALAYTGSPIKPTVSGLEYNGQKLTAGKDYRVVYGNPNPVATGGSSYDANNTGTVNGKGIGCVTVRFVTGGNFTSYQNMFFSIPNGLASAKVSGIANKVYTGKALTQNPVVKVGSTTLKKGTHYTVSYKNNKAIGTATVVITGKGKYAGARTATFKIGKKNPLTVKAKSPAVAYSKTAARNIAAKNAVAVSKAQGKVTYKKTAGNANITVSSAGKLTVKKGTKRNTYTVKVAVTAAGNKTYLPATKTVSVKVKVK